MALAQRRVLGGWVSYQPGFDCGSSDTMKSMNMAYAINGTFEHARPLGIFCYSRLTYNITIHVPEADRILCRQGIPFIPVDAHCPMDKLICLSGVEAQTGRLSHI